MPRSSSSPSSSASLYRLERAARQVDALLEEATSSLETAPAALQPALLARQRALRDVVEILTSA